MSGKRFPIMGGPSIPWEMLAPHERQALDNHDQSLATLASRGGLSPSEAIFVLDDKRWRAVHDIPEVAALADLKARLKAWDDNQLRVKLAHDADMASLLAERDGAVSIATQTERACVAAEKRALEAEAQAAVLREALHPLAGERIPPPRDPRRRDLLQCQIDDGDVFSGRSGPVEGYRSGYRR